MEEWRGAETPLNGLQHKEGKGAAREAPRLGPVGKPSSRAARGFSPTARSSGVVKQVTREGKRGPREVHTQNA